MILKLVRLKDWYQYIFICSIYFFIFNKMLSAVYLISLIFLLAGIYMLNDFFDLEVDLIKPQGDYKALQFRKNNRVLIRGIFTGLLGISLLGFFFISLDKFITAFLIILIMFLYSHHKILLKSRPFVDLFCIFLTYKLIIFSSFDAINLKSILLSSFIGLMAMDAHILQSVRDIECDSKYNIRTIASYLGEGRSFLFFKIAAILTAIYMSIGLYKLFGSSYYIYIPMLLLPVVFERCKNPEVVWGHFKILSGIIICFIILGLVK